MDNYYQCLDAGKLPVYRGLELNADDLLRREVITQLICHFELNKADIEKQYTIQFDEYFAPELENLAEMETDGLLELDENSIQVLPAGKLLIRNVCMVFDRYLREQQNQRFSKVI
jgi:oxygen-independent coproporphyrinogen-3 oxidase